MRKTLSAIQARGETGQNERLRPKAEMLPSWVLHDAPLWTR